MNCHEVKWDLGLPLPFRISLSYKIKIILQFISSAFLVATIPLQVLKLFFRLAVLYFFVHFPCFLIKMGKSSIFIIFALVLTFHSLVEGLDPEQKKLCLKLTKRTLKSMMKNFNACNEKLAYHKISGEEYQKKIGCIVKCVMEMQNTLDATGIMTSETLKKSIESQVPPEYVQSSHEKLMECVKTNQLDPKDENCKSYLDMGTCMQGAMVDMCGEAPMM